MHHVVVSVVTVLTLLWSRSPVRLVVGAIVKGCKCVQVHEHIQYGLGIKLEHGRVSVRETMSINFAN